MDREQKLREVIAVLVIIIGMGMIASSIAYAWGTDEAYRKGAQDQRDVMAPECLAASPWVIGQDGKLGKTIR